MFVIFLIVINLLAIVLSRPTENERVKLWYENKNVWPPKWQNETLELQLAMAERELELLMIPGSDERWENYMQFTQSRMVPRFTELGFEVINTPPDVAAMLKAAVDEGIQNWDTLGFENHIDAVYTPLPSKFIRMKGVEWEAARALKSLHEEWAGGIELRLTSSYGVRMYQNGSSLVMHYDKSKTHVISSIIHIAHEYDDDNEPWPIEIQDHYGRIHAVSLEPGQMLFYESASCVHGRRSKLKGKYYGSLFVHFQPVDTTIWPDMNVENIIANVPPHWREGTVEDHGSRYSGQGLTIDSMIPDGAQPRIINGEVVTDIKEYYSNVAAGRKQRQIAEDTVKALRAQLEATTLISGSDEL